MLLFLFSMYYYHYYCHYYYYYCFIILFICSFMNIFIVSFRPRDHSQPSLLDLDTVFSSESGGGSQMPTPLKPTSTATSKTPHIAPPLLPSPPLGIRGGGATSGGSSGGGPVIATTAFNTKPIDPSGGCGHN